MDHTLLYTKLSSLPESMKTEVSDFIDFLSSKVKKTAQKQKPKFGSAKGMLVMKTGFDDPLDDFKEYS